VGDYCYGPENGGLMVGGLGTNPHSGMLSPLNYARAYRSRSNALINAYKSDLKRQLRRIPADIWLNSELVRIDMERSDYVRAMESAMACRADRWWCDALRAYVMHSAGLWKRADSTWNHVLAAMPESERCAWLDPSWIVNDAEFLWIFAAADCARQVKIAERFWWLADPLYSIPGNERRSEHLSRIVDLILSQWYGQHRIMTPAMAQREGPLHSSRPIIVPRSAASDLTEGVEVAGNLTRSTTRVTRMFGYPELVMRVGSPPHTVRDEEGHHVVAQYPTTRASFAPRGSALLDHLKALPNSWNVTDSRAYEFMSNWRQPVRDLQFQVAHFRRGGLSRIIAATDVSRDSVLEYRWLLASITVAKDHDAAAVRQEQLSRNLAQFSVTTPRDSALLSLEVVDSTGVSGRVRMASGPPPMPEQRFTASDLLLIEPREPLPDSLAAAARRALGTTLLLPGAVVGVFWEMYGLQSSEPVNLSLAVSPPRAGALGRLAENLNLRRPADSLIIQWEDARASGLFTESRAVNIDLSSLRVGEYTLSLSMNVEGQETVVARRTIEIRELTRGRWW
jgi:hypothetical protein